MKKTFALLFAALIGLSACSATTPDCCGKKDGMCPMHTQKTTK